ncbi:MAG: hypothetical protein AAFV80_23540 [Bacteroidota bacterium]
MRFFLLLVLIGMCFSCKPDSEGSQGQTSGGSQITEQPAGFYVMPFRGKPEASIDYQGEFKKGLRWMDQLGENTVFISAKETKTSVEFWVEHFLKNKEGNWERHYQFAEKMTNCEDVWTLEPIEEALTVSDLNKDGIGEFTFLYKKACVKEATPIATYLYLVEDQTEYQTTGSTQLRSQNGEKQGGDFEVSVTLTEHSPAQAQYVELLWKRFVR